MDLGIRSSAEIFAFLDSIGELDGEYTFSESLCDDDGLRRVSALLLLYMRSVVLMSAAGDDDNFRGLGSAPVVTSRGKDELVSLITSFCSGTLSFWGTILSTVNEVHQATWRTYACLSAIPGFTG